MRRPLTMCKFYAIYSRNIFFNWPVLSFQKFIFFFLSSSFRHSTSLQSLTNVFIVAIYIYTCIVHHFYIYTIICLKSVSLSVDIRRLQVAILARSPREMSQTDRIVWQYILSRVRISVRPSIFYTRKTSINYRECRVSRIWLLNEKGRNAGLTGDRSTVSGKHTRAFNGHSTDRTMRSRLNR